MDENKSVSEDEASFPDDNEDSEESSSHDSNESAIHVSVSNKNAQKKDYPYGIRHNSPSRVSRRNGEFIYKENNTESEEDSDINAESEEDSDSESGDEG